ncbi:acyltransferase [Pollutibacter soli]|uniref:acyltransferase family protein n=1 Tax=Pollutibacter soli TaxID=3034157 RepID=UPI003013E63A
MIFISRLTKTGKKVESGNPGGQKIEIVETIRGFAALAVCLFHFTKTNISFSGSSQYFKSVFTWGWVGVEAFFVLSGFIIVYSLVKSKYTLNRFFKFFAKRCARIEPPYLISVLLVIVLSYLSVNAPGYKGAEFKVSVGQVLSHIAYLPEHLGYKWLQPVYWSLEAEFHYYILIGLFLPFLWKNLYTLIGGFLIGLTLSYFIPLYVFSYMPLFVMGISTAAYKLDKISRPLYLSILLLSVAVSLSRGQHVVMSLTGLATALAIVWVRFNNGITEFLGKISFSLYLMHVPIGGRVLNYAGRYANEDWKVWLSILVALAVTIFASWVFYRLVEYPSLLLGKKIKYKD